MHDLQPWKLQIEHKLRSEPKLKHLAEGGRLADEQANVIAEAVMHDEAKETRAGLGQVIACPAGGACHVGMSPMARSQRQGKQLQMRRLLCCHGPAVGLKRSSA